MSAKKSLRRRLRSNSGDGNPSDLLNPWRPSRQGSLDRDAGRKARQLCRQVAETLDYVLTGECDDEVLQNLCVLAVDPAPNTSRLLVTVGFCVADPTADATRVMEHLERAAGKLRCEVAAAIHRRRTPQLVFQLGNPLPRSG